MKASKVFQPIAICSAIALAQPAMAESVTLEFLWGIGKSSSKTEGTNSKFCKNRTWGGLKGFGLRYVKEKVELHVAKHWQEIEAENCNRSNWIVGVGGYVSTLEEDKSEDFYVGGGLGLAYKFNETWRDHGPFSLYGRADVGVSVVDNSSEQVSAQVGVVQYGGWFEENHGEQFLTLGVNWSELDLDTKFSGTGSAGGTGGAGGTGSAGGTGGTGGTGGAGTTIVNNVTINNTTTGGDSTSSSDSLSASSSGSSSTSSTSSSSDNSGGDGDSGGNGGDGGDGGNGGDGGTSNKCHHVHGCNFPPGLALGVRKK